jgi:hypothetical protein
MKITLKALMGFYSKVPTERQEIFLSNWGENIKPIMAVKKYVTSFDTLYDGILNLSGDLISNSPEVFVEIMRELGFDGVIVNTENNSSDVQYLIVWSPEKCRFEKTYYEESEEY